MPFEKFTVLDDPKETLRLWQRKLEFLLNRNLNDDNIASTSLTLGAAQVKASNIDFGTGADQVDAADILIVDNSSYYSGATVELALAQLGSTLLNIPAENVKIVDAGGYYASTSVEGALQEVGYTITNTTANITLNSSNQGWIICNTSNAITVTLPSVSGNTERWYRIRNVNTGTVTIDSATTDLIDGSTSFDLYAIESLSIVNDGTQWREG